ncbi:MAG: gliding motility-associated C-terminal domain-containing protein [Bacteroidales bacterium]|nr:gliding motility-associated C-terminal domain-containing protein [Bacteroidales bacterium]
MKITSFVTYLLYLVVINTIIALNAQGQYTVCTSQKGIKYKVTGNVGSSFNWMVEGGQIVSESRADIITVNWGNVPGNYSITVYEETAKSCLGNNIQISIQLNESPFVNLGEVRGICEGEQIEFNPGEGYDSYLWQDGSSASTYVANENGIYWVEVTNQNGCTIRDSVLLIVSPPPLIDLGGDTMLCASDELLLDAGDIEGYFDWSNGENTRNIIAREGDGQIWVKVTDSNGCIGNDTIQILQCTNRFDLIIPNAFTPNGDGYNDLWLINGYDNYPNLSVRIYDPWGTLVFQSENGYSKPWDGKSNGKDLPVNAYYYVINPGDGSKEIVGSITLIR